MADERIQAAGLERAYRLVVPRTYDPREPAPLVFAFHGFLIDSKDNQKIWAFFQQHPLNDTP